MNNAIAGNIRTAAIILLIIYVIAGFLFISLNDALSFTFGIAMIGTGVVTALLYYGFSEMIRLLQELVDQKK